MAIRFRLGLWAADLRDDLSRFHLLHYGGRVDGFLVSGHNSGTHWLRFMLSAAIAHHLDLPRPIYSSGPLSDVFIGHARHKRLFPDAPKIGSSHHMPSRLIGLLGAARFIRLPPVVLLVRHIPDSLLSYFFKWRDEKDLGGLSGYLGRAPRAQGVDVWWFIRFFNRWGRLKQVFPRSILIVRYEDVQRDPATWVRRIWAHYGVELDAADLRAAMAVSSRTAVQACLDPAYGEDIAPDRAARDACRYGERDVAVLEQRLAHHLRHAFGYAASVRRTEPAPPARDRDAEPAPVAA